MTTNRKQNTLALLFRQFPPIVLVRQLPHLFVLGSREAETHDRPGRRGSPPYLFYEKLLSARQVLLCP